MAIQDDTASFILVDRKNTRCKVGGYHFHQDFFNGICLTNLIYIKV